MLALPLGVVFGVHGLGGSARGREEVSGLGWGVREGAVDTVWLKDLLESVLQQAGLLQGLRESCNIETCILRLELFVAWL